MNGSWPRVAVRAIAPRTPPLEDGLLVWAPRTAPSDVLVELPVDVEPGVLVLVDVLVEVEPVVVVVDVVLDVVELLVVELVVVELVLDCVVVDVVDGVVVVVVVVVDVVPPLGHRLASWLCGPGVDGPSRMSPACLLWPLFQPLMLIEITTKGVFAEPVLWQTSTFWPAVEDCFVDDLFECFVCTDACA